MEGKKGEEKEGYIDCLNDLKILKARVGMEKPLDT